MSRIAKYPVAVPDKVQVTVDNQAVTVKGPLGTLKHPVTPQVTVKVDGIQVTFAAANES
jgi:large subunit ribosomal protein L6